MAAYTFDHWPAALLALVPALLNVAIVVYAMTRLPRSRLTFAFALFVTSLAAWQFGEALARFSGTAETAAFWLDASSLGSLLIGPLGLHFVFLFSGRTTATRSPLFLTLLYLPALVFEVLGRAGLNTPTLALDSVWGWITVPPETALNRLLGFWVAGLALATLAFLAMDVRTRPKTDPQRLPALLALTGFAIPTLQGAVTQVFFPTVLGLRPLPIASTTMSAFSILVLVALSRYRFLRVASPEDQLADAKAAIDRDRLRWARAQRIAHFGSWELDLGTHHVEWSDEMYRLYGHAPQTFPVTFERAMQQVVPEDARRIREKLAKEIADATRSFKTGGGSEYPTTPTEYRIRWPDGSEHMLHSEGSILSDAAGRPAKLVGAVQDVTEPRRLESEHVHHIETANEVQRLKEVNEFKTRFMNTAAHELNTPLTPLRIQLHLLRTRHLDKIVDPQARAALDMAARNVDRMVHLVQDVLDATRLQADRLQLRPHTTDLNELVQEAVDSFSEGAQAAGVSLTVGLSPGCQLEADPLRLTQVLYNLLTNAIKFTPSGGRVAVETRREADGVLLRVTDSGIGVRPDDIARLFHPFSQLPAQAPRAESGTGLGLYICRGIVESHGGRIWAKSPGPGAGSTFFVHLPLRPQGVLTPPPTPAPPAAAKDARQELEERIRRLL